MSPMFTFSQWRSHDGCSIAILCHLLTIFPYFSVNYVIYDSFNSEQHMDYVFIAFLVNGRDREPRIFVLFATYKEKKKEKPYFQHTEPPL